MAFFEVYKIDLKSGITKFKVLKVSHIELIYRARVYGRHKKVRPYVN
jgi:hypothetical protein